MPLVMVKQQFVFAKIPGLYTGAANQKKPETAPKVLFQASTILR